MSEEIRITRRNLILLGFAVLAVAFLGVLAGNWFMEMRQARKYDNRMSMRRHASALIKEGDQFPSVELIDLNSESANTDFLVEGHKTVIITLEPGCEPCALVAEEWQQYADDIPHDLDIFGITNVDARQALEYKEKTGFPFPVYCDTARTFTTVYGLEAFPTVIGLDDVGRVSFVSEGWPGGLSPIDAYEKIIQ